jgi:hypothetical protein
LPTKDKPGKWHEANGLLAVCDNGLHLTDHEHIYRLWMRRFTDRVFLAEHKGALLSDLNGDKYAARKVRLLEEVPVEPWVAEYQEDILELYKHLEKDRIHFEKPIDALPDYCKLVKSTKLSEFYNSMLQIPLFVIGYFNAKGKGCIFSMVDAWVEEMFKGHFSVYYLIQSLLLLGLYKKIAGMDSDCLVYHRLYRLFCLWGNSNYILGYSPFSIVQGIADDGTIMIYKNAWETLKERMDKWKEK